MRKLSIIVELLVIFGVFATANAQVILPARFNHVLVAAGLTQPTTMAVAPDGRFFIAQENGALRVVKNGVLLSQPFVTLNVNTNGERGLLGITFDPSFNSNQFIYLCYTIANGSFNRVSRFTANGDIAVPGSEQVIIDLDTLIANYHTGGHLAFGPDGKLYIATGENGRSIKSQDLDSYLGKILRVNPDGSAPLDNPFPGPGKRQRVWSYGMRNPFTFAFQPGTGRLFVDDVGEVTWEEINDITLGGGNYGWPNAEGMSTDTSYVNPFYTYMHGTGMNLGCAITGGTFFNPDSTNYPPAYTNKYYFIDYCGDWINAITITGPPVWSNFASNTAKYAVGITTGPDGNLYYLSRNNEALYKITYSEDSVPFILTQPQSQTITLGSPVTFYATASGFQPLSFQWRKATANIGGATGSAYTIPATAFSDSGNYNVVVTNAYGTTTSNDAHLIITSHQPPIAVIDTPSTNIFYTAGDVIQFHGSATDLEDGNLSESVFEWLVEFHHDTHVHPGPAVGQGISSGSFSIPNIGETSANVFYRLWLIVHDSDGMVDSDYVDINPRTSTMTITTQPAGLTIYVDGQPFTSPHTILGVEGMIRTFRAPYSQIFGQTTLMFTSWSNGGTLTQTFQTPVNDTLWAAYYDSLQLQYNLGRDTVMCLGDSIILDAGSLYNSYAWTDGSVGEFLIIHSNVADTITVGVTITDSNGKAGNDSIQIIYGTCNSIRDLLKESVNIFPVPSGGEITINGLPEKYFLNIMNMTGRSVISSDVLQTSPTANIHLEPGVYSFVIMEADHHVFCHKNVVVVR